VAAIHLELLKDQEIQDCHHQPEKMLDSTLWQAIWTSASAAEAKNGQERNWGQVVNREK